MEDLKAALLNVNVNEKSSKLRCALCNHCLSVGPVVYNDFYGNICGRKACTSLTFTGNNSDQVVYESVASLLIFPCMYMLNGCQAQLKWGTVADHENSCQFRHLNCPLSQNGFRPKHEDKCDWVAEDTSGLLNHIEEKHSKHFFNNILKLDLEKYYLKDTGDIFFTKIAGDIVVVSLFNDDRQTSLICKMYAGLTIQKFLKYHIEIFDKNGNDSVLLHKSEVNLLRNDASQWKMIGENHLTINFAKTEEFLFYPKSFIIALEYNNVSVSTALPNTFLYTSSIINLEDDKCANCSTELLPPVFVCLSGHNICDTCKIHDNCPKCSTEFQNFRNVAFEKLKLLLDQSCKYNSRGCTYVASYLSVSGHEQVCWFKQARCFYCGETTDNVFEHFKLNHMENIKSLNSDSEVLLFLTQTYRYYYLFDGHIFEMRIKACDKDENIKCEVICLGTNKLRYKYELCLFHEEYLSFEIKVCYMCHPEENEFLLYSNDGPSNSIRIPHLVLKEIFPDVSNLRYKLNISRIKTK